MAKPSIYHAVVVLFLEFFAFGLLTIPMLDVLKETFHDQMFLINGLVNGIKGLLSFLSAPLLGALSDVWGRRSFLILTVFVTCAPIPFLSLSPWWFFAMLSLSGTCSVTFSIIFAYVADITNESQRSSAYGIVSATFAASLVTSPAIGNYLAQTFGVDAVVALATAIASFDVCFILVSVPESLPEQVRPKTWGSPISCDQADPFAALRKVGKNKKLLLLCLTVFLSYLPEAGQYAFVFLYVQQVIGFTNDMVVSYVAVVGILAILTQTVLLGALSRAFGYKTVIILGLLFQLGQLLIYAFCKPHWAMWVAGCLAALSSINYPSLSSWVSTLSSKDQQGVVQGVVTGIRGLCNGLGPVLFGLIFYAFHVEIYVRHDANTAPAPNTSSVTSASSNETILPGPPYLFGAVTVLVAIATTCFIPKNFSHIYRSLSTKDKESSPESIKHPLNHVRSRAPPTKVDAETVSDSDDEPPMCNSEESQL